MSWAGRLDQLATAYVRFCRRFAWHIVGAALILTATLGISASRVDVDARIQSLLPAGTASQLAVEELRERSTSDSPLYLLVTSSDPELNRTLQAELSRRVASWPDAVSVISQRDPAYFLARRMLYLPADQTQELAERVEWIVEWEECDAIPGCVNLDDRPRDPTRDEIRELFEALPEVEALTQVVGEDTLFPSDSADDGRGGSGDADPAGARPGELCNPEGTVCAVQISLEGDPSDLAYAEGVVARAEELFDEVRSLSALGSGASAPLDLRLETSGAYRNAPLTKRAVVQDLANTASLSFLLMVGVLLLQFRCRTITWLLVPCGAFAAWAAGPPGLGIAFVLFLFAGRSFALLLVPVGVATVWTLGFVGAINPTLNLISAFTLAILAGLGIDFGVHLLTFYGAEREAGKDPEAALCATLTGLGPSMAIAALTTGAAFAALMAASFRGFAEMGLLAAVGVAMALVAFVVLLPPLVLIADRIAPERGPLSRPLPPSLTRFGLSRRFAGGVTVLGLVVAAALAVAGLTEVGPPPVQFEYDFSRLRPSNVGHGIDWGSAMHGTTRSAVYLISDDTEALEAAAADLRERGEAEPTSAGPALLTPASFVPPEQAERLEAIGRLREAVLAAEQRSAAEELTAEVLPLLDVREPITPDELPAWVRAWLFEADGRFGNLAVLYTNDRGSDARQMEALANQLDAYRARYPKVRFASGVALLGEVVPSLRRDAPTIVGLALLGLALATLAFGRSVKRTLLVLSPLVIGAGLTVGAMALLDLRVNFYNLMVLPLAFGIGVDGAIYVVWAAAAGERLWTSGRAVLGSTLTTLAAFGAMGIADNPGLVSLAALAGVALGATLLSNLLWLPALLGASSPKR